MASAIVLGVACQGEVAAPFGPSGGGGADGGSGAGGDVTGTGGMIPPGAEDCVNGVDDDDDELVDCADEDCTTHACVATPPRGWLGPVTFSSASASTPIGACGRFHSTETEYDFDIDAAPADCSPCSCGSPNITCSTPGFNWSAFSACPAMPSGSFTPPAPNVCQPFQVSDLDTVSSAGAIMLLNASCMASGGVATVTSPSWQSHARVCSDAALGVGCDAAQTCAPIPTGGHRTCVTRDGDHQCPGGYGDKTLIYSGFEDSRSCNPCSCTQPTGASCSGQFEIYVNSSSCADGVDGVVQADGSDCVILGFNNEPSSYVLTVNPIGGACSAMGGEASGEVLPTGTVTVCCQPR